MSALKDVYIATERHQSVRSDVQTKRKNPGSDTSCNHMPRNAYSYGPTRNYGHERENSRAIDGAADSLADLETIVESSKCTNSLLNLSSDASGSPLLMLEALNPREEFLLSYFSENIAPEMVVMDDIHNGWRYLILPIAYTDELVMKAVTAVSTFHISNKTIDQKLSKTERLYEQAISGLKSRAALSQYNEQDRHFVFLTIIILLVGVMVNGYSDFPILFSILQAGLQAIGGEAGLGKGELARFLVRQIRKLRVYAAPLLSPETGVYTILTHSQQSFDCLHHNSGLHPDLSSTFDLIANLRQQAYDIYLHRALLQSHSAWHSGQIEQFKLTLESLPEGTPGIHSLVWPTFIAASDSRLPEHRQFFQQFLEAQYLRNGFVNILSALQLLQRIWTCEYDGTWPALLPEPKVFIM
ncbi:hypothetical protein FE257_010863 [Aspergillus nanangensis]|uniref:Uncharacterized protein n=1 Tax=Aspergillus nanangensis TaxID=2582783 RepID=A0AAD4CVN2_ASPNN|nr:hypothetical protein FE257_010863 [Aspergillus nanangensis]